MFEEKNKCFFCGDTDSCVIDKAHVIPVSLSRNMKNPPAFVHKTVPMCVRCHRKYDKHLVFKYWVKLVWHLQKGYRLQIDKNEDPSKILNIEKNIPQPPTSNPMEKINVEDAIVEVRRTDLEQLLMLVKEARMAIKIHPIGSNVITKDETPISKQSAI